MGFKEVACLAGFRGRNQKTREIGLKNTTSKISNTKQTFKY